MINDRYAPLALGVLRIMSGLLFLAHGTQTLPPSRAASGPDWGRPLWACLPMRG